MKAWITVIITFVIVLGCAKTQQNYDTVFKIQGENADIEFRGEGLVSLTLDDYRYSLKGKPDSKFTIVETIKVDSNFRIGNYMNGAPSYSPEKPENPYLASNWKTMHHSFAGADSRNFGGWKDHQNDVHPFIFNEKALYIFAFFKEKKGSMSNGGFKPEEEADEVIIVELETIP